jgi:[protein-PII] uridylyltransferase
VKAGYKLVQGRIDLKRPEEFLKDKLNLLRVFEEGLRTGYLLHPNVMRLVASNLHLIDDDMREDPEAAAHLPGPAAETRQPRTQPCGG